MNSLAYVISSRIRVARNLHEHPFPYKASTPERKVVLEQVRYALQKTPSFQGDSMFLLDRLDPLERKVLEEQYVLSHAFAAYSSAAAVCVSKAQNCSILINEEDHLRIQAVSSGLALRACRRSTQRVERYLQRSLQFAYSEQAGYLTACSQNAGTGIRISAMLFLPGLIFLDRIKPLVRACVQDGYTVRGAYGEGSRTEGYRLQFSLQAPYRQQIESSLEQFSRRCRSIVRHERVARLALLTRSSQRLRKRMYRAKQRLKHSRSLSLASALHIIAIYRLGICVGLRPPAFRNTVMPSSTRQWYLQGFDRLSQQIQAAHIRRKQLQCQSEALPPFQGEHEDELRARLLKEGLEAIMKGESEINT